MQPPKSFIFVIFGASGDLTQRKLIPALFSLYQRGSLGQNFFLLGVSRTDLGDDGFQKKLSDSSFASKEDQHWDSFMQRVGYYAMDPLVEDAFDGLKSELEKRAQALSLEANYIFHLATPPELYAPILQNLALHELVRDEPHDGFCRRIIIEKPFGSDYESARELDELIQRYYHESQIYRIDHYLGKETVQNILVYRFGNGIFEPLWNRMYIDHVEITAVEQQGVLNRGAYYDHAGALRDMIQNHLLQLLALVAMEPPALFDAQMFRAEVLKVLQTIQPIDEGHLTSQVVRGQYLANEASGDKRQVDYRQELHVAPDSRTETFVALKVWIDNWRWKGVPFYLRTGKGMPTKVSEIVIHFKETPHQIFREQVEGEGENKLILRIMPDEGILLRFALKNPGAGFDLRGVEMDFKYADLTHDELLQDPYARLIYDCLCGDQMLFTRSHELMVTWKLIEPILKAWKSNDEIPLFGYPAGSWGPKESVSILSEGQEWTNSCQNLSNAKHYCLL